MKYRRKAIALDRSSPEICLLDALSSFSPILTSFLQILSGTLTETRFAWPPVCKSIVPITDSKDSSPASAEDSSEEVEEEMKVLSETDLHVNDVAYMSGESDP